MPDKEVLPNWVAAEITRASGLAYGTVEKVYNSKRAVAAVTRAKLAKAVSKLSGREYSVDDLFPTEGLASKDTTNRWYAPRRRDAFPETMRGMEFDLVQWGVTVLGGSSFVSPCFVYTCGYSCAQESFFEEAKREFERAESIRELSVGSVTYHLRHPLKAQGFPDGVHGWTFSTEEFAARYVGTGETITSAQHDFARKLHVAFQSLVRLRPFQMNDQQLSDWRLIERLIDVEKYWESIPLVLWEVGFISKCGDTGRHVVWLDGHRKEYVTDEQAPPDFVGFDEGQWFEALVERQPSSNDLRKVQFARPTAPLRQMTQEEFQVWLKQLPSGEGLPESKSDWRSL